MNSQTLDSLKKDLIVRITNSDDERFLHHIKKEFEARTKSEKSEAQLQKLKRLAKPMRKKMTIDALVKEQNWKPIDRAEFDGLVRELDIQEPLEDLIADIGK